MTRVLAACMTLALRQMEISEIQSRHCCLFPLNTQFETWHQRKSWWGWLVLPDFYWLLLLFDGFHLTMWFYEYCINAPVLINGCLSLMALPQCCFVGILVNAFNSGDSFLQMEQIKKKNLTLFICGSPINGKKRCYNNMRESACVLLSPKLRNPISLLGRTISASKWL